MSCSIDGRLDYLMNEARNSLQTKAGPMQGAWGDPDETDGHSHGVIGLRWNQAVNDVEPLVSVIKLTD